MAGPTGRFFVAAPVPEVVKAALVGLRGQLEARWPLPVRWVKPDQMHLTLKFIGDFERARLPQLEAALVAATAGRKSFALKLAGLGAFPNLRRARMLWVGLEGDTEPLAALAGAYDEATAALGVPRERRPFVPHLTLGRASGKGLAYGEAVTAQLAIEPLEFVVSQAQLIESHLRPGGSVYELVRTFSLG